MENLHSIIASWKAVLDLTTIGCAYLSGKQNKTNPLKHSEGEKEKVCSRFTFKAYLQNWQEINQNISDDYFWVITYG